MLKWVIKKTHSVLYILYLLKWTMMYIFGYYSFVLVTKMHIIHLWIFKKHQNHVLHSSDVEIKKSYHNPIRLRILPETGAKWTPYFLGGNGLILMLILVFSQEDATLTLFTCVVSLGYQFRINPIRIFCNHISLW